MFAGWSSLLLMTPLLKNAADSAPCWLMIMPTSDGVGAVLVSKRKDDLGTRANGTLGGARRRG